jgi:hypothetical protein
MSYQPFSRKSVAFWPLVRQKALHHCYEFIRKFISLATDSTYDPFQWIWPTSPMHAIMILLVDLYEWPYSEESSLSRAYIDELFAILDPEIGGIRDEDRKVAQLPYREGGRKAWNLFRQLREKAWQKAGCDPNISWTGALLEQVSTVGPNTLPVTRYPGVDGQVTAGGSEADGQPHTISECYPTRSSSGRRDVRPHQFGASPPTTQNSFSFIPSSTSESSAASMVVPDASRGAATVSAAPNQPFSNNLNSEYKEYEANFDWDKWDALFKQYGSIDIAMDLIEGDSAGSF